MPYLGFLAFLGLTSYYKHIQTCTLTRATFAWIPGTASDVQINIYPIFTLLLVLFGLNQRKSLLLDIQCASWACCYLLSDNPCRFIRACLQKMAVYKDWWEGLRQNHTANVPLKFKQATKHHKAIQCVSFLWLLIFVTLLYYTVT